MDSHIDPTHPLFDLFNTAVRQSIVKQGVRLADNNVEEYLTGLLLEFIHTDRIFSIRDKAGRRLLSITDMVAEGDVMVNADSFERERQVHKHIGDYILFWAGVYPEYLRRIKLEHGADFMCDYLTQGKRSYYLVSTFDYGRYSDEAQTFRKLSLCFEDLAGCLSTVRNLLPQSLD